jgi:hypothetical protein
VIMRADAPRFRLQASGCTAISAAVPCAPARPDGAVTHAAGAPSSALAAAL